MRAVRAVTTYKGRDPRDFILFAFGGAGGLHAVELAKTLKIKKVLVPKAGGVLVRLGFYIVILKQVKQRLSFLY